MTVKTAATILKEEALTAERVQYNNHEVLKDMHKQKTNKISEK